VAALHPGARLLDVGCGGHSPSILKHRNPRIHYTGIDITAEGLSPADLAAADDLVISTPGTFASDLRRWADAFDAVISSHNLEHVDDPPACLDAMFDAVAPGGSAHLSFPSAASRDFPSRGGSLNFQDDPTHRAIPDLDVITATAAGHGMTVTARIEQHRPPIYALIGRAVEPMSARRDKVMPGTWAFWGFESVLVLHKPERPGK
jgi:SAM-dependent methyltransferase